jgi:hypothetical protein
MRIGQRRRRLRRWAVRSLRKTRQSGGFFPLLAPLIPYAVAAATGAAGAAGTAAGGWGMSKLLHGIDNRRPKSERIRIRQARRSTRQARRVSRRK